MPADKPDFRELLTKLDIGDAQSIENYALHLKGMTFQDVLNLDIKPAGYTTKEYSSSSFKGGVGNLIEERFFGYKANSDEHADFPEAEVEVKTTCYDIKKNGVASAGERLVLTMIPYDREITSVFEDSHVWEKCHQMLLIYYHRDKDIPKYAQEITKVGLFKLPEEDLEIVRQDYKKIVSLIQEGRADELSEGMTTYLGACTKGATAEKSIVNQYYKYKDPTTGQLITRKAKKRAFSLKRQYMDYVLHRYFLKDEAPTEKIVAKKLKQETFDEHIINTLKPYFGKTDKELCGLLNIPYTGKKAQWTTIVYKLLGIKSARAEEFVKAGISLRCIRVEANGSIKESLSFTPFKFKTLINENWEDSRFRDALDTSRFFFVMFKRDTAGNLRLYNARFWSMPISDIESEARRCWERAQETVKQGVTLTKELHGNSTRIINNLPKISDSSVAHVRPHSSKGAYKLDNGTVIGDIKKDANELPDGRWMTTQSFWLNSSYLEKQLGTKISVTPK